MIDEYQLKELISSLGANTTLLNDLTKSNIINSLYLNCSEEQKAKVTEAFVQGLCTKLQTGGLIVDQQIIGHLVKENLISINLHKLSYLIKDNIEIKVEKIFKEIDTNHNYSEFKIALYSTLMPMMKKIIQEVCAGNNKIIMKNALHAITIASASLSLKDHAEKLLKKAQTIIDEEIIKEIIE